MIDIALSDFGKDVAHDNDDKENFENIRSDCSIKSTIEKQLFYLC
jgi:hypothetical protein